jgi:hypothetical protein
MIFYSGDLSSNRDAIHYGINNYYNIYPQTSSFTTSSFAIYATSGSVSASLNNDLVSGISSTGPLGFITVSRTGSNSLTIARNGVTSSFAVPASGALSTGIYLGAINNNGLALANSPLGISFASVGTGLTSGESKTYSNLVLQLQSSLGRGSIITQGLILNLDAGNRNSYPGSGSNWFDLSGNNYSGSFVGTITYSTASGGVMVFPGTSGTYIDVSTLNKTSTSFTFSTWLNIPVAQNTYTGIVVSRPVGGSTVTGINFLASTGNRLSYLYASSFGYSGPVINYNTWYRIDLVFRDNLALYYINGILQGTNSQTSQTVTLSQLRIGNDSDNATRVLNGSMGAVQIYDRGLSEAEIVHNYYVSKNRFGI